MFRLGYKWGSGLHPEPLLLLRGFLHVVLEGTEKVRELHREDVLRRRARTQRLQGVEVLESHRLRIDRLCRPEDLAQRLGVPLSPENGGLLVPLGPQDRRLLVTLRDKNRRLPLPVGFKDHRSPRPLRRHLLHHRLLHVGGGSDLPDLDVCHLDAPPLRHFVELRAEDIIDLLPLREKLIERDIADDGPKSGGRDPDRCPREVLDLHNTLRRLHNLVVDQEVDICRSVVLGDAGLVRDLEVPLSQVYLVDPVDDRNDEDHPGTLRADEPTQGENDDPLVFSNNLDRGADEGEDDYQEDCDRDVVTYVCDALQQLRAEETHDSAFSTTSFSPLTSLTFIRAPFSISPGEATVQSSAAIFAVASPPAFRSVSSLPSFPTMSEVSSCFGLFIRPSRIL